ncbi:hypothetical protein NDU88_009169 [Pleurodeles waltl]|uniref:Uncharacterized protein n=1 Tax=Pleurodeles waltl TaxID=8319 RepID=A0AAV7RWT5_PLEWA|nr:hypothetical protein NDU88_009169 [Pleurodeles waltl]
MHPDPQVDRGNPVSVGAHRQGGAVDRVRSSERSATAQETGRSKRLARKSSGSRKTCRLRYGGPSPVRRPNALPAGRESTAERRHLEVCEAGPPCIRSSKQAKASETPRSRPPPSDLIRMSPPAAPEWPQNSEQRGEN